MGELIRAYKYLPTILKDARLSKLLMNLSNHNAIDFNLTEVAAPKDSDKIRLSDLDYYQRARVTARLMELRIEAGDLDNQANNH